MSLVYNEQTKLLATALNNSAVAYIAIGFVTPMTTLSFKSLGAPVARVDDAVFTVVWLGTGCTLHSRATRALRGLKL